MQSVSKKQVKEFDNEIRSRDRIDIIKQRRISKITDAHYDKNTLPLLIDQYMNFSLENEIRYQLFSTAIYLTTSEYSIQCTNQLCAKNGLLNELRKDIYDENLSLQIRQEALLIIAQMLNTNGTLYIELNQNGLLDMFIDIAKQAFLHHNIQFLDTSLIGIENCLGCEVSIREYLEEQNVDILIVQILNSNYCNDSMKTHIVMIMNEWFASKSKYIKTDLIIQILDKLLIIPNNNNKYDYEESLIWFLYQFITNQLDIMQEIQEIDHFLKNIFVLNNFLDFLKSKFLEINYLGSVAAIRTISKIFRKYPYKELYFLLQDDINIIYKKYAQIDVNIIRIEILKLIAIVNEQFNSTIMADYLDATLFYYNLSTKLQEITLQAMKFCHFDIFAKDQLNTLLDLIQNLLLSAQKQVQILIYTLTILFKIMNYDEFHPRLIQFYPYIECYTNHENSELATLAYQYVKQCEMIQNI